MNIAIILTWFRIVLIPIFAVFFCLPGLVLHYMAATIFFFAAITDWFDGYIARKFALTSSFGAFLDPVADKLMVIVALVLIVGQFGKIYLTLPALVIVGREVLISSLREWMAEIGKRTSVAVGKVAKIKTTLQMVAIQGLLIYHPGGNSFWFVAGMILLYVSALLTLWSMVMYLRAAWPDLTFLSEK
jgi:CDP-diacylglycerol---glycerol-3-phosphate 3-phosphatidyltransferase